MRKAVWGTDFTSSLDRHISIFWVKELATRHRRDSGRARNSHTGTVTLDVLGKHSQQVWRQWHFETGGS